MLDDLERQVRQTRQIEQANQSRIQEVSDQLFELQEKIPDYEQSAQEFEGIRKRSLVNFAKGEITAGEYQSAKENADEAKQLAAEQRELFEAMQQGLKELEQSLPKIQQRRVKAEQRFFKHHLEAETERLKDAIDPAKLIELTALTLLVNPYGTFQSLINTLFTPPKPAEMPAAVKKVREELLPTLEE